MIALISAVAKNGVIGIKNRLPWNIPEDLKHFQQITSGKTVMMGSKTFESILSILGKPLPNRTNIVLAHEPDYKLPTAPTNEKTKVVLYRSIDEAVKAYGGSDIFVIGGGQIYRQTIDLADKLYITHVDREVEGDAYFPPIDPKKWKLESEEKHEGFSFAVYTRV